MHAPSKDYDFFLKMSTLICRFLIHVEVDKMFSLIVRDWKSWPINFKNKVQFQKLDVWYPPERSTFRDKYSPCASELLFLPEILSKANIDSAIYMDTDMIFMRDPADLWNNFYSFNSTQLAAIVEIDQVYLNPNIVSF